jgi:hypothetical protein
MPLPILPGVARVSASGPINGGGRWQNTWHVRNSSLIDFDPAGIAAANAIFQQFYIGPALGLGLPYLDFCNSLTTCDNIAWTPLNGISGAVIIPVTGTHVDTNQSLPAECSPVLTLRTTERGRQNRGRIYLPAMNAVFLDVHGRIPAAVIDYIKIQAMAVQAALVTGGASLGVGSYGPYKDPTTGLPVLTGAHFTPLATVTMDDKMDVQRGRKS